MAAKKPNLDEPTRRIAERLLNMSPKTHDEMKLGKGDAKANKKPANEPKMHSVGKGRVHKGKSQS